MTKFKDEKGNELLSPREIVERKLLPLDRVTVRRLMAAGTIKAVNRGTGTKRIAWAATAGDVAAFAASRGYGRG
jgi:hypothetical protein